MSSKKLNLAILCGGRSGEHEVSLISTKSILSAIDRKKYEIRLIGIEKSGRWRLMNEENFLQNSDDPAKISLSATGEDIFIWPAPGGNQFHTKKEPIPVDVVFPVLHGTYGEDGTLQGMLDMLGIPYVGAGYLGSATAMDKVVTKRLFREAGLPIANYLVFTTDGTDCDFEKVVQAVEKEIPYPVFIKPANLGSSVGINKATCKTELINALKDAWQYDTKIVVEQGIDAREIECSLLGNQHVEVSELGEIKPRHAFYSYEAKYIDPDGAELLVGVEDIDPETKKRIQATAISAFKVLGCEGMARADFLVEKKTGRIFINELNTIPGFTKISMYPKLWEISGIPYTELIDRLISLALERHKIKSRLKTEFSL